MNVNFDPTDNLSAIQAAIDSGAREIVLEHHDIPWRVSGPILCRSSDQRIILEPRVVVTPTPGSMLGREDNLFRIESGNDIRLQGYGARIEMRKDDYITSDMGYGPSPNFKLEINSTPIREAENDA